jgi:hypothetical protein
LQDAHYPEMGIFLDLGLAAGHVCAALYLSWRIAKLALGRLPRCRVTIGRHVIWSKSKVQPTFVRLQTILP